MTTIKTGRLTLRPIEASDAARFATLCNDIDIARNTARVPHPYTPKDAYLFVELMMKAFRDGTEYAFAVCEEGEIIACAGVMALGEKTSEIGYWVGAGYRGRGVATQAARAVTQFAVDKLGAGEVLSGHFKDNPTSGRVLQKVGFRPTGETEWIMSAGRGEKAESLRLSLDLSAFERDSDIRFA